MKPPLNAAVARMTRVLALLLRCGPDGLGNERALRPNARRPLAPHPLEAPWRLCLRVFRGYHGIEVAARWCVVQIVRAGGKPGNVLNLRARPIEPRTPMSAERTRRRPASTSVDVEAQTLRRRGRRGATLIGPGPAHRLRSGAVTRPMLTITQ